jgi:hypothetical protein
MRRAGRITRGLPEAKTPMTRHLVELRRSTGADAWRRAPATRRVPTSAAGSRLADQAPARVRQRTLGDNSAGATPARAAGVACLAILAASFVVAGEVPAPPPQGFRLSIGLLVASGLGPMSSDLNHHPGFGLALAGYIPVGSRFRVRPAFEWTGYRVSGYNLASRLLAEVLGAAYQETRVVFRTYRLGVDGVLYFGDLYRGPFVSGGAGVQRSRVYIEDVLWYGTREEDVEPVDASSSTTALWLGGGAGYQWSSASLELRLSRAPYRFTTERPTEAPPGAFPFEPQPGWALHLIIAVTF